MQLSYRQKIILFGFLIFVFCVLQIGKAEAAVTTKGLVGFWSMDNNDFNGATMFDKTGLGNNLTKQGSAGIIVQGKIKQAANLVTAVDHYSKSASTIGNYTNGTIVAWINPALLTGGASCNLHNGSGSCRIIAFNDDHGYFFAVNFDGALILDLGDGATWLVKDNTAAGKVVANKWQLVAVTVAGTNVRYYVNGVLVGNNTVAANNGLKMGSNSRLGIGGSNLASGFQWSGMIDEVRIYNRDLSAAEIVGIYNAAPVTRVASAATTRGLVGNWTLDVNDISAAQVEDKSFTAATGSLFSVTSTVVKGVLRDGRHFDGINDYIDLGVNRIYNNNPIVTFSTWFRTSTTGVTQEIIAREDASNSRQRGLYINTDNTLHMVCNDLTLRVDAGTTATVTDGKWHLATGVRSGSTVKIYLDGVMASSSINASLGSCGGTTFLTQIGRRNVPASPNYFNGDLDDMRIYKIALTDTEIYNLYKTAKLSRSTADPSGGTMAGYWTMDNGDTNGARVFDKADANNIILTGTTSVVGKYKQARSFNGSTDLATIGTDLYENQHKGTIAAWVKLNALPSTAGVIFGSSDASSPNNLLLFLVRSTGKLMVQHYTAVSENHAYESGTALVANRWYHVVVTSDGTQWKMYINGVPQTLSAVVGNNNGRWFGDLVAGTNTVTLGYYTRSGDSDHQPLNGFLDDVREYNRPLSAAEVNELYHTTLIRVK